MNRVLTVLFFISFYPAFTQNQAVSPVFQTGHYARINQLIFHSDNQHLISAADDGRLVVWDIYLGLQVRSTIVDQSGVKDVAFLTDSSLVTLTNNGAVQTWTYPQLEPLSLAARPVNDIQAITVINASTLGLAGRKVYLYHLNNQKLTTLDYTSKAYFTTISYQKERNEIAVSGPVDNYCATISLNKPYTYKRYVLGNINTAQYSSHDHLLLSETSGSLVSINLNTAEKRIHHLKDNHNYVNAISEKSGQIAIASTYGFTQILSTQNQTLEHTIGLNGVALSAIDYSPNEKWLATGNHDGTLILYETENYKLNRILKGASAGVTALQLFKDDLFIGYSDGIIRRLNLPHNKIVSNSIKQVPYEEKAGISYTILSIDELDQNHLEFTVLKTDRHHEKNHLLRAAQKFKSIWNLETNEILLQKEIEDIQLRLQVDHNYRMNNTYQLKHYLEEPFSYPYKNATYTYSTDARNFIQIKGSDTLEYATKHEAPIEGLRFSKEYDLILSYSTDGSIRFWDTAGNYKAALYLSGQYGFTYWNAENFYFSSKEMLEKIGFNYKNKLYSFEQFDVYYNRPNEVMNVLPFFPQEEIENYEKAYYKRLEKLGIAQSTLKISERLPKIDVDYKGEYSTKAEKINFELTLDGNGKEITQYSYRINGIEQHNPLEKPTEKHTVNAEILLAAGLNQIEFYCQDEMGVKSLIKKVNITCEKNFSKPELYLISIGVSQYADSAQNLVYAQKDAEEVAQLMQKNKQFKTVHEKTMLNSAFSSDCLAEIQTFLAEATINDVILFYYAGHGILDAQLDYYLATYDMDFNHPEGKGISFDTVEAYFESLNCRNKLMMVDACFSGEIDKTIIQTDTIGTDTENGNIRFRKGTNLLVDGGGEMGIFELAKMTFIDLNRNNSTNILSSASGVEYAMESEEWQNGLFTFVLKDGILNEKADLNGDKLIRIMELQIYLRETVSALSGGQQNPILRKENSKNNFVIW